MSSQVDVAALAALVSALTVAVGALGINLTRGQRDRARAEVEAMRADTASTYATAAATAVEPLVARLAAAEEEIKRLQMQLLDAAAAANRFQRGFEGLKQQGEIAREIAGLEIARLRAQLEADAADYHREINLIRAELEAGAATS